MLRKKYLILLTISMAAVITMLLFPAIPQEASYHEFADQRAMFGIPNFLNVISNIPYLVFGLFGCFLIFKESQLVIIKSLKIVYLMFFMGVILVFMGSVYYHLNPDNSTLFWDRLPMSLAFMSFFTVIIGEYIHKKAASQLYFPLLLLGMASVIYWYWSETIGEGDLRLYILVQFLPVILIPIILRLFSTRFTHGYYFALIIGCYVLAKGFEMADQLVFDTVGIVSGHSLKHLISAVAPYLFYLALKQRKSRELVDEN
ncbi:MAG: alkaline phytoceramidase [Gammaproteobacteria bacterium]|nr:alkaline phytoceramidase [Gammaproteobacteria bacterium]